MGDGITMSEGAPEDEAPPELPQASIKEPKIKTQRVHKPHMTKAPSMPKALRAPRKHERRY